MEDFIVTDAQKEALKSILTHDEYKKLDGLSWKKFFLCLDAYILYRFRDDEPTKEGEALQRIYDEVYNQN